MKTVTLVCEECDTEFERLAKEAKRNAKLGRKVFCGQSCSLSNMIRNREPGPGKAENLVSDNRRDELTSFRWYLRNVRKRRARKGKTDLTLEWLKDLWESQKGTCPLTGWKLALPDTSAGFKNGCEPHVASLDRIDNGMGYVKGNVRFIAAMANFCRQRWTDAQVIEFCQAVAEHKQETR